jgi:hypothetical protein
VKVPRTILSVLVLFLFGIASPSVAQRGGHAASEVGDNSLPPSPAGKGTAGNKYADFRYGVVKSMSPSEMVLTKTASGLDEAYKLNKKTKFIHDGKGSSPDSVRVGDKVWVDAHLDKKTGDSIARKVLSGTSMM